MVDRNFDFLLDLIEGLLQSHCCLVGPARLLPSSLPPPLDHGPDCCGCHLTVPGTGFIVCNIRSILEYGVYSEYNYLGYGNNLYTPFLAAGILF